MSLTGWDEDKKLELTIAADDIDSTLTNFPVLVNLRSTSGKTSFDASAPFDELTPNDVDDDFTGTDGDAPDVRLWTPDISSSGTLDIYSNKLRAVITSATSTNKVTSLFTVSGDFDVQVDFDIVVGPTTNIWLSRLMLLNADGTDYVYIDRRYNSQNTYASEVVTNTSSNDFDEVVTTDTDGKFRIVRSSSTITCYYWNGSSWTAMSTYASASTDAMYVRLQHATTSSFSFTADFDNFKVNSGTIVWPNTPKKLAFELGDTGVQCFGEIENWDYVNKRAALHVNLPSVAATADTILNLYYDETQQDNDEIHPPRSIDDDFTGDNGDAPDSDLWDISEQAEAEFSIESNTLKCASSASGTFAENKASTKYKLSGDFDCQVDFGTITSPENQPWIIQIQVKVDDNNYVYFRRENTGSANRYYSRAKISGSNQTAGENTTSDTSGKFQIVRSGSTLTTYYWNGTSWTTLRADTSFSTGEVEVMLQFYPTAGYAFELNFDNFTVNSGTILPRLEDDFTGTDGDAPRTDLWKDTGTGNWQIDANQLKIVSDTWDTLKLLHILSGDFDVQVNFDCSSSASVNDRYTRVWIASADNTIRQFAAQAYNSSALKYESNYYDSSWGTPTTTATTDTTGKLRIVRVGNVITSYYWNGTSWTSQSNHTYSSAPDIIVSLLSSVTSGSSTDYYDNFKINYAEGITGYIDDTGETPAQNVWDANFVAVYHMAQDPSGGASCILDSTGNANHGTPYGSMTSGDLIDGATGKVIEFDNTDDFIDFGDIFHANELTVEALCKSYTVNAPDSIVLKRNTTGTANNAASAEWSLTPEWGQAWDSAASDDIAAAPPSTFQSNVVYHAALTIDSSYGYYHLNGVAGSGDANGTTSISDTTNAIQVGARSSDNDTRYWNGWIGEVRLSDIARSADWIAVTNLSLTDVLVTFALPPITGDTVTVISVLEQLYNLPAHIVMQMLVQEYMLTDKMVRTLVQIYGLKMVAMLVQRYGDIPVLTKVLKQWYGDAAQLMAILEQPYADAYRVRATLDQPYVLPEVLLQILNQRYSIGGVLLRQVCDQQYNLMNVDLVRSHLVQPFNLLTDTTSVITPDPGDGVVITPQPIPPGPGNGGGGTPSPVVMEYTHINIEGGSDQYCLSCEVHLASQAHYNQISILDDLTISLLGQDYEFFVESKQRRRGFGTAEYAIVGLSKTALMDEPYADTITADDGDEYVGMASAIVTALAAPTTVHWNTVDWHIPANTLIPSDETPLSIIKNIAAAAGAIVQTEPNGDITIEPYWPIPIPDWTSTTPDYVLSDSLDFFTTGEDYLHKPGYNRYLVGDDEANNSSINFEGETLSTTTKNVRAYQVPWTGIFDINHTGCSWVLLEDQGVETRTIEDEVVEFIDGVGSTQYPIYSIVSYEWQCDELGTLEYEEDGSLISTVENESLLKISYQTKCQLYLVTDPESEQVQVVAEDI